MPTLWSSALLVIAGLAPSLIWISFYLRKDTHPEPRSLLTKTFLMGVILSPIAVVFQYWFINFADRFSFSPQGYSFFLWAAFVEELVKYYAVKTIVFRNPDFDEPVDAMIYMITAGLGFAAIENILVMFKVASMEGAAIALQVWFLRFIGATFLHALSSGLVGYFLAGGWFYPKLAKKLIITGLFLATAFHFTFNMFLSLSDQFGSSMLIATLFLLFVMAFLVSILFDSIKRRQRHFERLAQQPLAIQVKSV